MLDTARLQELALIGLKLERERIDREIEAIKVQLTREGSSLMVPADVAGDTYHINVAKKQPLITPTKKTHPRTISPEGRKRLSLLAKRRWKAARQNGKHTL